MTELTLHSLWPGLTRPFHVFVSENKERDEFCDDQYPFLNCGRIAAFAGMSREPRAMSPDCRKVLLSRCEMTWVRFVARDNSLTEYGAKRLFGLWTGG